MPLPGPSAVRIVSALVDEPDGLTRDDLREAVGSSKTTIQAVVSELLKHEVLIEGKSSGTNTTGRPAQRLSIRPEPGLVAGIDFGRNHLRVALAETTGELFDQREVLPFDLGTRAFEAVEVAAVLLGQMLASRPGEKIRTVGVGLPAPIKDGRVVSTGYLEWAATDFRKRLATAFAAWGGPPRESIFVANDADLAALGEAHRGSAQGASDYCFLKVSTGVGLGLVLRRHPYRGAHGAAGEWGHTASPAEAEKEIAASSSVQLPSQGCLRCKRFDCLENLASFRAIVEGINATRVARQGGGLAEVLRSRDDAPQREDQQDSEPAFSPSTKYVSESAVIDYLRDQLGNDDEPTRDPLLIEVFTNAARRIGYALVDLIRTFDPELVIIGGHFAEASAIVEPIIKTIVDRSHLPPARPEIVFLPKERVRLSEIDGAIALAQAEARRQRAEAFYLDDSFDNGASANGTTTNGKTPH